MTKQYKKRELITLEDACDRYDAELDQYIQESVWEDGFSENYAADMLSRLAKADRLRIDWDNAPSGLLSGLLWDIYQCTEKGLS